MPIWFSLSSDSVLNFRRVTGRFDLGECQSLDADDLPSAVHLSPVKFPPLSNDGCLFLFELESNKLNILAMSA